MNVQNTNASDRLLTLKDVQDRFGVSRTTLWRWEAERGLKVFRVGKVVRVRERELEAFFRRHQSRGPSAESSQAQAGIVQSS